MGSTIRRLTSIYLVLFFRAISWGIFDLVFPIYMVRMGISAINWGILVAVLATGMLFFEPIWGFLSDIVGKKVFIVVSMFSASLIIPMYSFKEFVSLFIVLQFVRGILKGMVGPSSRAFISDTTPPKDLGTAMGLSWSSMLIGAMVGSIIGSLVSEAWTCKDLFYLSSVIALLAGILALLCLRKPYKHQQDAYGYNSRKLGNRGFKIFLRRNMAILLILAIISVMGLSLIRSFLPIFIIRQLSFSAVDVGITLAIFNGASIVAAPLFGRISDKMGRKALIVSGFCLFGLTVLFYPFVKEKHQVMLVTAVAATSYSFVYPSLLAFLANSMTLDTHGAAMGVYGACEDLGAIIAPISYGIFWSAYGPTSIFYVYGIIAAVGVISSFALREEKKEAKVTIKDF